RSAAHCPHAGLANTSNADRPSRANHSGVTTTPSNDGSANRGALVPIGRPTGRTDLKIGRARPPKRAERRPVKPLVGHSRRTRRYTAHPVTPRLKPSPTAKTMSGAGGRPPD